MWERSGLTLSKQNVNRIILGHNDLKLCYTSMLRLDIFMDVILCYYMLSKIKRSNYS
jgi:hypothetical protein